MRLLISIMVLSPLLLGITNNGGNDDSGAAGIIATTDNKASITTDDTSVRVVDATPKDWMDYVTAGATIALAFFTIVLAAATIYYAVQTKKNVEVSRELIKLNEAQNNIVKAQLLSKVYELSHLKDQTGPVPDWAELEGGIEHMLGAAVRIYLKRATMDLLGEDFKRKVMVKLRDDNGNNRSLLGENFSPGQQRPIPMIMWEHFQAITHGEDPDFEFIEYVDSE